MDLDYDIFAKNLREMTADHLRPLLDSAVDTARFWRLAQDLARATVPDEIVDVVRLGRMTALCKPNGGVRGIVAGDMVRRLVARTISQQISKAVEQATSPFQYALSTKSGGECIAHSLQALTDLDPAPLCCPSTESEHSTSFLEVRCWMVCAQWQAVTRCSHSWCNFMAIRLPICGTTMMARPTRSGREKEESRAILLCPCCMLSGSTKLCNQCNLASVHTRDSWLSTMMCTPLHSQSGLWRSTGFWERSCGSTAAFGSMPSKPRSGTGLAMFPAGTKPSSTKLEPSILTQLVWWF